MIVLLTVLSAEFTKLKRSYYFLVLFVISIFISIFGTLIASQDEFTTKGVLNQSVILINYMLGVPIFSIFTGLIFAKEYEQGTISYLFTSSYKRIEFLLAKIVLIFCLISFMVIFTFVLSLIIGMIFSNETITLQETLPFVKIYLLTIAMQFALTPLVILLTIIWKNYIISIALGIVAAFSIGIITATPIGAYYPWSAPLLITYDFLGIVDMSINIQIMGLLILFVSTLLASLICILNSEVK